MSENLHGRLIMEMIKTPAQDLAIAAHYAPCGSRRTHQLRTVAPKAGFQLLRCSALNNVSDGRIGRAALPAQIKVLIQRGIMLLVIGLAIFSHLGIAVAMVLTGCLSMDEAYQSIDWRTVFLVGGMLSLGIAMENTGTAQYLANILLGAFGDFGPIGLLAGIYILSALITQPMSNAAAIVLMVPIAVDTALGLNVNYLTFTMAVVIGAATSFITPVGHKANVLVFGPGGYRFLDYTKVGVLLTIALFIVSMIFLPIIWPFYP